MESFAFRTSLAMAQADLCGHKHVCTTARRSIVNSGDYKQCPWCGASPNGTDGFLCGTILDVDSPGMWDQRCGDAYKDCESFEDCCDVLFSANAKFRKFFGADESA